MTELSSQITDHTDPNEARVRYSPLDVSRLIKGQIIQVAELEPIIGLTYPDPRWSLRVLQLRSKIEVQRDRKGLSVLTMRYHAGTLARMRSEYVVPLTGKILSRIEMLEKDSANAASNAARNKLNKDSEKLKLAMRKKLVKKQ